MLFVTHGKDFEANNRDQELNTWQLSSNRNATVHADVSDFVSSAQWPRAHPTTSPFAPFHRAELISRSWNRLS
jgi:hypothetical protein